MVAKSEAELILEGKESSSASSATPFSKKIIIQSDTGDIPILTEQMIRNYSAELVEYMLSQTRRYKDFGMSSILLKQLIELKKAYWPPVQKNINANVTDFDKLIEKWVDARKQVKDDNDDIIKIEMQEAVKNAEV